MNEEPPCGGAGGPTKDATFTPRDVIEHEKEKKAERILQTRFVASPLSEVTVSEVTQQFASTQWSDHEIQRFLRRHGYVRNPQSSHAPLMAQTYMGLARAVGLRAGPSKSFNHVWLASEFADYEEEGDLTPTNVSPCC